MALSIKTLENWLWEAASVIRGPIDAPKFKDYILPLIFLKRLSDVFEDEIKALAMEYGSRDVALQIVEDERREADRRLWEVLRVLGVRMEGENG